MSLLYSCYVVMHLLFFLLFFCFYFLFICLSCLFVLYYFPENCSQIFFISWVSVVNIAHVLRCNLILFCRVHLLHHGFHCINDSILYYMHHTTFKILYLCRLYVQWTSEPLLFILVFPFFLTTFKGTVSQIKFALYRIKSIVQCYK